MDSVSFKLPPDLRARLEAIAAVDDVSIGQLVRTAIERDLRRRASLAPRPRAAEHILATVRSKVVGDFEQAGDWAELKVRLAEQGYSLREAGGGLALHEIVTGRFLCRTSEIGFGYPGLIRRFGKPFPGHCHTWLLDKIREVPVYTRH